LGEDTFQRGMALYVARHDGSAATCEDFVRAMEDAAAEDSARASFSFERFRRWYHQAGTPVVRIQRHWDGSNGRLELTFHQHTPATPGQPHKEPLVIPLAIGLVDRAGEPLLPHLEGEDPEDAAACTLESLRWGRATRLLVLEQAQQRVVFEGLPPQAHPPALSLLRHFSAPVRLEIGRPIGELVHLFATDSDGRRLMPIFARLERAGARNVQVRAPRGPKDVLEGLVVRALATTYV
jgi:aminopeptidase N